MRRLLSRLLWAAFVMVQYAPMPVSITLKDGKHYIIDAAQGSDGETEIQRIKTGYGDYGTGWVVARDGNHIQISEIKMMRVFEGNSPGAN